MITRRSCSWALCLGMWGSAFLTASRAAAQEPIALSSRWSVGLLEGEPEYMFGHIVDVASDGAGNVYVLDQSRTRLSVFDERGHFVTAAEGKGEGPGEFNYPVAMARDDEDRILVLDSGNRRINTYVLQGTALKFAGSRRTLFSAMDLCTLGSRVFVLGYFDGFLVHELSPGGGIAQSFGEPFRQDNSFVARATADGKMECVEASASVLIASEKLGIVAAYSADGERRWSKRLSGFNAMIVEVLGPGRVRYSKPEDGGPEDLTTSLLHLGREMVLVQFGKAFPKMGSVEEIQEVQSRVLSIPTGEEVARTQALPRLDESDGTLLFSHGSLPYPRATVYAFRLVIAGR